MDAFDAIYGDDDGNNNLSNGNEEFVDFRTRENDNIKTSQVPKNVNNTNNNTKVPPSVNRTSNSIVSKQVIKPSQSAPRTFTSPSSLVSPSPQPVNPVKRTPIPINNSFETPVRYNKQTTSVSSLEVDDVFRPVVYHDHIFNTLLDAFFEPATN